LGRAKNTKNALIKILLIEKKRNELLSFSSGLVEKGFEVVTVSSGKEAMDDIHEINPHVIVINAPSIRSSGQRICRALRKKIAAIPIVLIVDSQEDEHAKDCSDVVLRLPFTLQKLLNRIRPLIPNSPTNVIRTGVFELDLDNRIARCGEKQIALTPRQALLLKVLMDHKGEVIERKTLFCEGWDTDYTDDMRTLDVHISWLRQALEDVPKRPKYIKTIRGVGYRLDI